MYNNFLYNQQVTIWEPTGNVDAFGNPTYEAPIVTQCRYEKRSQVRLNTSGNLYLTGDIFWCGVNLHDMVNSNQMPRFMLGDNTSANPTDGLEAQTIESVPGVDGVTRMWRAAA